MIQPVVYYQSLSPVRQSFILSLGLHILVAGLFIAKLPDFWRPQPQILSVKLVSAPNVRKTQVEQPPVRTQQSEAPPAPPKPPEPKPTPPKKKATATIEPPKEKPKPKPPEPEPVAPEKRPDKLDKTPNKQHVQKAEDAPKVSPDEAFLAALDFVNDLEKELPKDAPAGLTEGEVTSAKNVDASTAAELGAIQKHIARNWLRPAGLASNNLNAIVEIKLTRDGDLIDARLTKSSGDLAYDNSVLRAVRKSVPLPIPAEKYNTYKNIELDF